MVGRFLKIRKHRDGTVSYFSDKENKWIENVRKVPQHELDKMTNKEQDVLLQFLYKHRKEVAHGEIF
jgi:hypothetical protein